MAGAVNTPKNGNAMSNTTSSNKNSNTTSSNKNSNTTSSNKNGATSADGGSTKGGKYRRYPKKHTSVKVYKETETHDIFKVRYYNDTITTTVTDTTSVVDQWIEKIYADCEKRIEDEELVLGLDTEWEHNKVDVLQLCLGRRCLIFQFFGRDKDQVPESLVNFLNDHRITFVRAGINEAAHKLSIDYGLSIATTEDLGCLADYKLRTKGLYQVDLKTLVNVVLGKHLHPLQPKFRRIAFGKWDVNILTDDQVQYACLDAYASFKLGLHLLLLRDPEESQEVSPRN